MPFTQICMFIYYRVFNSANCTNKYKHFLFYNVASTCFIPYKLRTEGYLQVNVLQGTRMPLNLSVYLFFHESVTYKQQSNRTYFQKSSWKIFSEIYREIKTFRHFESLCLNSINKHIYYTALN